MNAKKDILAKGIKFPLGLFKWCASSVVKPPMTVCTHFWTEFRNCDIILSLRS